jgi:hypothetical protein
LSSVLDNNKRRRGFTNSVNTGNSGPVIDTNFTIISKEKKINIIDMPKCNSIKTYQV